MCGLLGGHSLELFLVLSLLSSLQSNCLIHNLRMASQLLFRDLIQSSDDPQLSEDFASTTFVNPGDNMIQTKAFNPAPDVPLKPASATSVAVEKTLLPDQNIGSSYGSSKESGYVSYNQGL